ncbi:hypothetical protein EON76_03455 [bacterium]|nr:MAG: hypothetical protein EON76_03455 [bacterium]
MTKHELGSIHVAIVVAAVISIIGLLVGTFFQVMKSREQLANSDVQMFSDCKQLKMSRILETYPEQCVTVSGRAFTNPDQKMQAPAVTKQFASKKHAITFSYPSEWTVTESITNDTPENYVSEVIVKDIQNGVIATLKTGGQYGGICSPVSPTVSTVRSESETVERPGFIGKFGYAVSITEGDDGKYRLVYGLTKTPSDSVQRVRCPEQTVNYEYIVSTANKAVGSVQFGQWYNVADKGYDTFDQAKMNLAKLNTIALKKMIMSLEVNS